MRCVVCRMKPVADLFAAGLFRLATPRIWGGCELGPETWIEVTARLAAACVSCTSTPPPRPGPQSARVAGSR